MEQSEVDALAAVRLGLGELVQHSLSIVLEALDRFDVSEMVISFNGGKDSVVLLQLINLGLQIQSKKDGRPRRLHDLLTVYFELSDSFDEVTDFVKDLVKIYDLNLKVLGEFKEGLTHIKEHYPIRRAIFMGTRRIDPHGSHQSGFEPTTAGWPVFMRVNPILEWGYHSVWAFIKYYKLPYCSLYDRGYTSIGQRYNTFPNMDLSYHNDKGELKFKHAENLNDESLERHGRPLKK